MLAVDVLRLLSINEFLRKTFAQRGKKKVFELLVAMFVGLSGTTWAVRLIISLQL